MTSRTSRRMRLVCFLLLLSCWGWVGCKSSTTEVPEEQPVFGYVPAGSKRGKSKQAAQKQGPLAIPSDPAKTKPTGSTPNQSPIQTTRGHVVSVNGSLKYIVIDYSLRKMPEPGRRVSLYRQAQKVGEARVTGPAMDSVTAADMLEGDARVGDEVRED